MRESTREVARRRMAEEMGSCCLIVIDYVSVLQDENVLEIGCTT